MEATKPPNSSKGTPKSTPLPLPAPVVRAVSKLGMDLSLARRRRHISQSSMAERMGASVSTVKRMEAGDVRVPVHFIARAMHVLGEIERFAQLMDTGQDALGLALMDENLPKRVRTRKATSGQGGL